MPNIGIISCRKHWKTGCPGIGSHVLCFDAVSLQRGPLGKIPEASIVSFGCCHGCPGDSIPVIAQKMLQHEGVEVIALASCLFVEETCPYAREAASRIASDMSCQVLLGTYSEPETGIKQAPPPAGIEGRLFRLMHYLRNSVKSMASSR